MLKSTFCAPYTLGESKKMILALLSVHALDLQVSFFKMTMGHNFDPILYKESDLNPLTKMWHKVFRSPFINHKLLEFIKLVKIVVVQVLGYIEDERIFSTMAFMKIKLWN
jgi:hypothetical protein